MLGFSKCSRLRNSARIPAFSQVFLNRRMALSIDSLSLILTPVNDYSPTATSMNGVTTTLNSLIYRIILSSQAGQPPFCTPGKSAGARGYHLFFPWWSTTSTQKCSPPDPIPSRLLEKAVCKLVKKISEARRAKNRRAEAYLGGTLERGD